ncbi:MAG: LytTR family DNA-binding domain-containing protein, partial [Bacillota bacterium]|nr:LytTR family DNA-binding domain-containing protein [Bacillota bacterium]
YNVPLEDILFIECRQKKAILHTKTEELTIGVPLYRLGEELPAPHFLQCHRSFLVNLKNIAYLDKHRDPWTIFFFSSKKKAFISRSFRHQVMDAVALSD